MFDQTFSGSEYVPCTVVQLSPKPQLSERRSNTICAVVEPPDHHGCDDLVQDQALSLYNTYLS